MELKEEDASGQRWSTRLQASPLAKRPTAVPRSHRGHEVFADMLRNNGNLRARWRRVISYWHWTLRPYTLCTFCYSSFFLSFAIIVGQVVRFSEYVWVSPLSVIRHVQFAGVIGFIATSLLCFLPLSYMVAATYISRLKVSVWLSGGLYPKHSTDVASLLVCSKYAALLTYGLCYSFTVLIRVEDCALRKVMGDKAVLPLVEINLKWLIVFVCIVTCLGDDLVSEGKSRMMPTRWYVKAGKF